MNLSSPTPSRLLFRLLSIATAAVLLVSCSTGNNDDDDNTSSDSAAALPTAADGELTVGELLGEVDAAWSNVTSFRMTSMSGPVPTEGNDTPTPQGPVTIEEWTAPNNRRIVERMGDTITNEQVFVDGKVYMWGTFVGTSVAPEVGPSTWVTLDPSVIPPDTPVGYRVSYITRAGGPPFGSVTEDMRQRPAKEAGTVQAGGRSCTVYTFVDTTQLGEKITYELAIDENNFPCQLIQRAGGFQNSTVYEVNSPDLQILAPDAPLEVSGTPEG